MNHPGCFSRAQSGLARLALIGIRSAILASCLVAAQAFDPVTTQQRSLITQDDLPRLRAWATMNHSVYYHFSPDRGGERGRLRLADASRLAFNNLSAATQALGFTAQLL